MYVASPSEEENLVWCPSATRSGCGVDRPDASPDWTGCHIRWNLDRCSWDYHLGALVGSDRGLLDSHSGPVDGRTDRLTRLFPGHDGAGHEPLPEAGALRTLEVVGSMPLLAPAENHLRDHLKELVRIIRGTLSPMGEYFEFVLRGV